MARAAELTYAATTRQICSAIRKLSRVNPSEAGAMRWRGVRGELPASFYSGSSQGAQRCVAEDPTQPGDTPASSQRCLQ